MRSQSLWRLAFVALCLLQVAKVVNSQRVIASLGTRLKKRLTSQSDAKKDDRGYIVEGEDDAAASLLFQISPMTFREVLFFFMAMSLFSITLFNFSFYYLNSDGREKKGECIFKIPP